MLTKYLTGKTSSGAGTTSVAHGVISANILSVGVCVAGVGGDSSIYAVSGNKEAGNAFDVTYDGTNIIIIHGKNLRGQNYRIRIDYRNIFPHRWDKTHL